ncbi:hypothetical protein BDV93DRAFT_577487 [Ceratobasidium sp. AG-I]|nr:hypothetical protein BDV93DRAFT_577487 [Ceratobasidium sp. AG-I]
MYDTQCPVFLIAHLPILEGGGRYVWYEHFTCHSSWYSTSSNVHQALPLDEEVPNLVRTADGSDVSKIGWRSGAPEGCGRGVGGSRPPTDLGVLGSAREHFRAWCSGAPETSGRSGGREPPTPLPQPSGAPGAKTVFAEDEVLNMALYLKAMLVKPTTFERNKVVDSTARDPEVAAKETIERLNVLVNRLRLHPTTPGNELRLSEVLGNY